MTPRDSSHYTAFIGTTVNTNVYLYSKMGVQAGATANAGFEEWAVRSNGVTQPPTGPTGSISGQVFLDTGPLASQVIKLDGTDINGQTVVLLTTTDASGAYTFTGLLPGTYSILYEQNNGFIL
jgi:hypothetical protein